MLQWLLKPVRYTIRIGRSTFYIKVNFFIHIEGAVVHSTNIQFILFTATFSSIQVTALALQIIRGTLSGLVIFYHVRSNKDNQQIWAPLTLMNETFLREITPLTTSIWCCQYHKAPSNDISLNEYLVILLFDCQWSYSIDMASKITEGNFQRTFHAHALHPDAMMSQGHDHLVRHRLS